ncbi:hypothetical protein ASE09_30290 [Streptomyces sp. Root66D1]|nr:hypothetical protein ASD33_21075 [Streptomyces sp. Root1304]KRA94613.1 hypothetical protein ASE09_30290 [Streptomyces sp. Root66D1]
MLAVTTSGLVSSPVAAVPVGVDAAVSADADQQEGLSIPADSVIASAGRDGMLTRTDSGSAPVFRWTRFTDGDTTVLPIGTHWGGEGTDIVASQAGPVYTLTDMSGSTQPIVIDTSALGSAETPYTLQRVVGTRLLMSTSVNSVRELHLVSTEDGRVVDREVALPTGTSLLLHYSSGPDDLTVRYRADVDGPTTSLIGVVDLSTGAVKATGSVPPGAISLNFSPTHMAWFEVPAARKLTVAVAPRGVTGAERVTLDSPTGTPDFMVRAIGDWAAYARIRGGTATWTDALHPLTVRSKDGETVKLLDHVASSAYGSEGSLIALGGTVEHGEGVYRIAPDTAGRPVATLLTGSGLPTALTVVKESPPPAGMVDFDRNGGVMKAAWTLSRFNASISLRVTHTASGLSGGAASPAPRQGVLDFPLTWNGRFDNGVPAYNGAYTWTMTAKPANGIGPGIVRTGTFIVTRAPKPHDFDDNGSPDLLSLDGTGRLRSYDVQQVESASPTRRLNPLDLGTGWYGYDRITATGNIAGTPAGDIVARDAAGVLWLHSGSGKGLAPRTRIGGGWQVYDKITGGSDLTGDGRPDVIAADRNGVLWLHPGTGNASTPFPVRKRIGGGWGIYNRLAATGNIAGAPSGDLVARDKDGILWLYLGKGDGTFAPRTRVGGGWSPYTSLVGVGDTDRDGRNDLIAYDADGGPYHSLYVYKGTGDWKVPFTSRRAPYNPGLGEGVIELF